MALAAQIRECAVCYAVGWATPEEIDALNILVASKLAMSRALEQLSVAPCRVLVDAVHIPQCAAPQTAIIGGDGGLLRTGTLDFYASDTLAVHFDHREAIVAVLKAFAATRDEA